MISSHALIFLTSKLEAQYLMASQIRSHVEYLISTDIFWCFYCAHILMKNVALLMVFQYESMIILKCPVLAIPYICAHCAHWGFRGLPIFLMCRDVPGIRFVFASVPNSGPNSLKPLFGTPILICRIRYCGWQAIYWKSTFSLICGLTFGETSPRREIQPLRYRKC